MLGNLIGGFIVILIGVNLLPPIADAVWGAQYYTNSTGSVLNTNVTGATATIVNLVTLFFSLGVMTAGVAVTVGGLRNAGVL